MGLPTSLPGAMPGASAPSIPILTKASLVSFATRNVQPPSAVYVTSDDRLHVSAWVFSLGQPTLNVTFRLLMPDGTVTIGGGSVMPTTARHRNDFLLTLSEGFLLSVVVSTPTTGVLRGQFYVELDIARINGSLPEDRQPLMSDYLTTANSFGWPGGEQRTSVEGPGAIFGQQQTGIAGNSGVQFSVPQQARWRLQAAAIQFTTSAVAGQRQLSLEIQTGGAGGTWTYLNPNVQAASLTWNYGCSNIPLTAGAASPVQYMVFPDMTITPSGSIIFLASGGLAGDTWNSVTVWYEEWLEPTS